MKFTLTIIIIVLISSSLFAQGEFLTKGSNAFFFGGGITVGHEHITFKFNPGYSIQGIFDISASLGQLYKTEFRKIYHHTLQKKKENYYFSIFAIKFHLIKPIKKYQFIPITFWANLQSNFGKPNNNSFGGDFYLNLNMKRKHFLQPFITAGMQKVDQSSGGAVGAGIKYYGHYSNNRIAYVTMRLNQFDSELNFAMNIGIMNIK